MNGADDLADEPVFRRPAAPTAADPAGVSGEPALYSAASAAQARADRRAWLSERWASTSFASRLGVFAALCVFSGAAAVACVFAKGSLGFAALAVVIGAPVVEEVAKAVGPLMILEKSPWLFGGAAPIVSVGFMSGLIFAACENLLYFFVYIPDEELTVGLVLWRLIACTSMHVLCTVVSCTGLARAWRRAFRAKGEFDAAPAIPWLVAAVVVHAAFNFCALAHGLMTASPD